MLQVKYGIALLALLVVGRRIDHGVTPGALLLAVVVDAAHLSVGYALLRTVIVTLRAFGNLDAASLTVATEEGLCAWVDEPHAVDFHKIVVEAHGQRVGDGHEVSFAIGLHVVLLAADIDNDFAGLWSLDAEVGASLLVNLREVVAGHGGLGDERIGGHLNLLGHVDVRTFRLVAQEACHGLAVAAPQLTVTGSVKVQAVRTVGAVVGRDDLTGMDGLRQLVNLWLAGDTDSLAPGLHNVADKEGHLLGLQLQVAEQAVIDLLHHVSPFRILGVRLALVHQHTLDDTVLLCLFGQCDEAFVGIVAVGLQHALHPSGCRLCIVGNAVGHEALDFDAANGHMDDADFDVVRQRCHQRAAEPVGRGQPCVGTAEGRRGLTPLTHLTAALRVVNSRHQQETRSCTHKVLGLRLGCTFHVRLSETEEDVEVRVLGMDDGGCQQPGRHHKESFLHS